MTRTHPAPRNAIATLIANTHGEVHEFLSERIERPGRHNLLDVFPCTLQRGRIVCDRLPKVIDPVRLARGHDVVVDGFHFRAGI